jgi:glycine dehydrogenase subunit 1
MSLMGSAGLEKANKMSYSRAHMLADMLVKTGRAEMVYANRPYLNEFAIELKDMTADEMLDRMARHGILAGVKLDEHRVLIAVTEKREISDIERYVELFKDLGKDE